MEDIDKEVCERLGEKYSEDKYSFAFMMITNIGDVCVENGRLIESQWEKIGSRLDKYIHDTILDFLDGKYKYFSYRTYGKC